MRKLLLPALLLVATTGCHARYRRNADSRGRVRVTVQTPDAAVVAGGRGDPVAQAAAGDVVGAGVEVATVMLGIKAQKKLNRGTDPVETRDALAAGVLEGAQDQPLPYKVGEKGRSELVITIDDWGLDASSGTPMAYLDTRSAIYNKDGKVVYRASERCERTLGQGMQIPLEGVDELAAMQQLADMKPQQMHRVLGALTEQCSAQIARELATHLR